MLIAILAVIIFVLILIIEKNIKRWGVRFLLVTIALIINLSLIGSIGVTVGRSMEENRYNRNLLLILSSLRDLNVSERQKVLDALQHGLLNGGKSWQIEELVNDLELQNP